jgi:hypothetical protein
LDDAVVHVGDVDRTIGGVADVHRPEQLVAARHEFRTRIHVAELGQPFDVLDRRAPDQTAHRLGEQQVAPQVRRECIAADDGGTSGRGEVIQVLRG